MPSLAREQQQRATKQKHRAREARASRLPARGHAGTKPHQGKNLAAGERVFVLLPANPHRIKEKSGCGYDGTSGAPIFANGAETAAFQQVFGALASGGGNGGSGASAEELDCKGSAPPDPAGSRWMLQRANPDWTDNLSVSQDGDTTVIGGSLTVSGPHAGEIAGMVNSVWGGATGSYDGVSYRSAISMSAVDSGGDWQVKWMARSEWVSLSQGACGYQVGARNVFGSSTLELGSGHGNWSGGSTIAHEFGHALGLTHAPVGSGSIMSYDASRSVLGHDLSNLANGYGH